MNEKKFKVWDKANKCFQIYGNGDYREWCVRTDGKIGWISKHGLLIAGDREFERVDYTGLRDKNGTEIYEGDILVSGKNYWRVVFLTGGFVMSRIKKSDNTEVPNTATLSYFINDAVKIIGNIYENPELLEGQNG